MIIVSFTLLNGKAYASLELIKTADYEVNIGNEEIQKEINTALKSSADRLKEADDIRKEREYKNITKTVMESEGYYEADVKVTKAEDKFQIKVKEGKPYKISKVNFLNSSNLNITVKDTLKSKASNIMRAQDILDDVRTLKTDVSKSNCVASLAVSYEVIIDDKNYLAEINFNITGVNGANFGSLTFTGTESVKEEFIRNTINTKEGSCYRRDLIDKDVIELYRLGLFSVVEVQETVHMTKRVDIEFKLKEKNHRTIKAGAGYNIDEAVYLTAEWQHRNIFGSGEELTVKTKFSGTTQLLSGNLKLPQFFSKNNTLVITAESKNENLDAYEAKTISGGASIQRKFNDKLSISFGGALKLSEVDDILTGREEYALASTPVVILYDKRDNILDPKKGYMLSYEATPYLNLLDSEVRFMKNVVKYNYYHEVENVKYEPVFAFKGGFGSIIGNENAELPADERFYVGGGGSVRGYKFQSLGDQIGGTPVGGRSFTELGFETRLRFTEQWGGVGFIDGGQAFNETEPQFMEDLQWAYGLGVRYYTSFAPIRFDVAVPINKRPSDDAFQFYISIGQAF